jgi:hypothetical protein
MNGIEKLDNVTWYGHCVIHFLAALNDLPDEAKVPLCGIWSVSSSGRSGRYAMTANRK